MKDREKEIKHLIYLKSLLIKECKKEIRNLQLELNQYHGEKRLRKEYKK